MVPNLQFVKVQSWRTWWGGGSGNNLIPVNVLGPRKFNIRDSQSFSRKRDVHCVQKHKEGEWQTDFRKRRSNCEITTKPEWENRRARRNWGDFVGELVSYGVIWRIWEKPVQLLLAWGIFLLFALIYCCTDCQSEGKRIKAKADFLIRWSANGRAYSTAFT